MRLYGFAALCGAFALCVLCYGCCFCFSLCKRILNCCLRNFALARATKGLCPLESRSLEKAGELFSFWCGFGDAVPLNLKSKMNRTKSVHFTIKTPKSPLRGRLTISLHNSKATASRAVSRKTRGGVPTYFFGGNVTFISVPCSGTLLRSILPFMLFTICFTIESPSPVPPRCFDLLLSTR